MLRYVLNLVYLLLLLVFLPSLVFKAFRTGKYRAGFGAKFLGLAPRLERAPTRRVWLHAVSVGEVNLAAAFWARYAERHPDAECVVSTTSRTGMELARKKFPHNPVFYAPLDFSWSVSAALRRVQPDMLVLVELELWPNLLLEAARRGVPTFIINGRLGDASFRNYRRVRGLMAPVLRSLTAVLAQDERSRAHFAELGVPESRLFQTGSMKFDGARSDRSNPQTAALSRLLGIAESDRVFLAGSTQDPEERYALEVFQALATRHPELRLILVPRHPERFEEVARMLDQAEVAWVRRSQLETETELALRARVLLVDCVGELGAWWGTAHVGFVGGSMGRRGGQNMLEPAAYGVAVAFGPNTWNFRDIVRQILAHDAAVVVHDRAELGQFVAECLENPQFYGRYSENARRFVAAQQGALDATLRHLDGFLPPLTPSQDSPSPEAP